MNLEQTKRSCRVKGEVLLVSIQHDLPFDDMVELISVELRDRPKEKCKGLTRNQVNQILNNFLSREGRAGLDKARETFDNKALVPDYVIDFVETQLSSLYPELKDHPAFAEAPEEIAKD